MSTQGKGAPTEGTGPQKTLAEKIAGLTPAQRAVYERKLKRLQKTEQKPLISRLEGNGPWPVTTDQSALWFIQQLEPSTSAYNIGNGFRIKGKLDPALLERCFNIVVQRHQLLRSIFKTIDGRPYQIVTEMQLSVPVVDVSRESDPLVAARAAATRLIKEPFDLEKGPLVRLPLVRVAQDDYIFIALLHHIITDWWSYYIFYSELSAAYDALSHNRPVSLPDLPIQFADWAAWRLQWEKTDAFLAQENYWLQQIQGATCVLELPADHPRPPVQSDNGARKTFSVPREIVPVLHAVNRRAGVSSFMTLLAIIDVFLWRYTREEQFLVGTPASADRDTEGTSRLIGYMLNTLVLRADLSGNPAFLQLLQRVRLTCMGAFANKEYPFRHLVDRLKVERDMSRMPVYQVEYLYVSVESPVHPIQDPDGQKLNLPGFETSDFILERNTSPVDLQVTFWESIDSLKLMLEYNTDIFAEPTINRMGEHMIGLLQRVLADPECPLALISLLNAEERRQILQISIGTALDLPPVNFPGLFEAQVAATPNHVAVVCGEESLSYSRLNDHSNCLAHHLLGLGAGPGSVVGICTERSLDMLCAMIAVLKSGAAYLPLDPDYPESRLAGMLADSAPLCVLTTQALHSRLPQNVRTIILDDPVVRVALGNAPTHNPGIPLLPGHPAYVIYTSGSTGTPNGVVIEHHAFSAFLHAMNAGIAFDSSHIHLAVTTINFDISILELLLPLCHGARVIIASREDARDAARLCALLRSSHANSMQATPGHWNSILQQDPDCLKSIRVLSGGEALPRTLAKSLFQVAGNHLYNLYGPTETTIWAGLHQVNNLDLTDEAPPFVVIGCPLANYRMYVLDGCMEPCPPGMAGDLYIAGAGLARGYSNRPALTAEKFIPDPFAASGERMYRTADVARRRSDGTLEFLGRVDQQVKVRGFRIELGEVEDALQRDPTVGRATVVVRDDGSAGKQLVAYLVPASDAIPDIAHLRRSLGRLLPDYMVPAEFVVLSALPLMPSGKIDRRALPAPERRRESYVAPTTPEETVLCAIFADVLSLDRVGVEDSFFALGGHSLLATLLISKVRTTLGVNLALRSLFEAPTVAQLAPNLQKADQNLPPIRTQGAANS